MTKYAVLLFSLLPNVAITGDLINDNHFNNLIL